MKDKKTKQTLWVTSISPEKIDGSTYIPSVLSYDNGMVKFGRDAESVSDPTKVNRKFKMDLGDVVPGGAPERRMRFRSSDGKDRSAFELTKDYFDGILSRIEGEIPRCDETFKFAAKIMVAEPLSLLLENKSKNWTKYYRDNIKRILSRYEAVEFLPEPFAVYQYYRYGKKIPHLHDNSIAFIIDFGGGTFDCCVIEAIEEGDVANKGKHCKPLAASTVDVGGFVVNDEIAKYLIKVHMSDRDKGEADKYLDQHSRVLANSLDVNILSEKYKKFISVFNQLEIMVEAYKLELSNQISDWSLDADCYEFVNIRIPKDPFGQTVWVDHEFRGHQLRKIFVHEIWHKKLKAIVKNVLINAESQLGDRHLDVTLVSGGSSNLRWLNELLKRDFNEELGDAKPVKIEESFQDIVANGLAIECARRYFTKDSEFVAVTYNPVKLTLKPDGISSTDQLRFKSMGDHIDMERARLGDILPSANDLSHFFDKELLWQVRLPKPPKSFLDYYFIRPDQDHHHYNVEQTRVNTTNNKDFDSKMLVSLVVREDGTAIPKFIYKRSNEIGAITENSEIGRPFHIDITTNSISSRDHKLYIGFDFGTSNSSLCMLPSSRLELINERQHLEVWKGLSEEVGGLPYPVAHPVKKFLANYNDEISADVAREAIEASLAFLSYFAVAEASALGKSIPFIKTFQHRSAGPLIGLLEAAINTLGNDATLTKSLRDLTKRDHDKLRMMLDDINGEKHNTKSRKEIPWVSHIDFLVQYVSEVMSGKVFGYVLRSEQDPFSDQHEVTFKVATDVPPFISTKIYKCSSTLPKMFAWIIDEKSGSAVNLSPLIIWDESGKNDTNPFCYFYNKLRSDSSFSLKRCDEHCEIQAAEIHNGFHKALLKMTQSGDLIGPLVRLECS